MFATIGDLDDWDVVGNGEAPKRLLGAWQVSGCFFDAVCSSLDHLYTLIDY